MTATRTESPPAKCDKLASDELARQLDEVTNVVTLDLEGIASALWAIAYADKNCGMTGGTPLVDALHWMERELNRKADHIRGVSLQAAQAIRTSRGRL
jgi:hypothetical protein